ncbi:SDR family oxidoreductase [uncultured Victivallis sp.]|uniref:SDR family oxidoreductase n=1 Tax=uncultured Victivallis sp. TaxID=354118 RepID=UPI0025E8A8E5|nr:SDR family oxidoreductase [uncultured Victivallis sp.]
MQKVEKHKILITGGAGFIGSNLVERFLAQENEVIVLDNFLTGKPENIAPFIGNRRFRLIVGDIRDMAKCREAVEGVDYVLHEAAIGSVPRSIKDPMTSTEINIGGFVNMLFAAQEAKVKRFVYAASSSTYGDSKTLPKVENEIGKPLSPYAITKYVDELFAENFSRLYGIETIGLRYFNVFGRRQDPFGAYAAVIPKFVMSLMKHESPVINGDGSYSRDFTYVDNVIQANELALLTENPEAVNQVYNIAFGERTTLNELFICLRENLSKFDPGISGIEPIYGPNRAGDIPHSLACIDKAAKLLGYAPKFNVRQGLKAATEWYYENL